MSARIAPLSLLRPYILNFARPVCKPLASIKPYLIARRPQQTQLRAFSISTSSSSVHGGAVAASPLKDNHDLNGSTISLPMAPLSFKQRIGAYSELAKLKLSTFVVITAGAGFSVAPSNAYDMGTLQLFGCAMLGTLLCSSCANTINQIREIEFDALMKRTANRPLPSGLMSASHASIFAAACGISGTALLFTFVNPLTAALGAANILLYAGPYTSMKRTTTWNTWVGAIVGAVPPVMGWTAVTGSLGVPSLLLAGILFSWQLPHFMSLAYMARVDYTNGGYKMLSCSDPRAAADTAVRHSLAMSLMLFALPSVLHMSAVDPSITHNFGTAAMYGAGCSGLIWAKIAYTREITMEWAKKTFLFSLLVVPIIMAAGAVWWLETQVQIHEIGLTSCPHELINAEKAINSASTERKQE